MWTRREKVWILSLYLIILTWFLRNVKCNSLARIKGTIVRWKKSQLFLFFLCPLMKTGFHRNQAVTFWSCFIKRMICCVFLLRLADHCSSGGMAPGAQFPRSPLGAAGCYGGCRGPHSTDVLLEDRSCCKNHLVINVWFVNDSIESVSFNSSFLL